MTEAENRYNKMPLDLLIASEIFLKGEFIQWCFCEPLFEPKPSNDSLFFYAARRKECKGLEPLEFFKNFHNNELNVNTVPAGSFYEKWISDCPFMEAKVLRSGLIAYRFKDAYAPAFNDFECVFLMAALACNDAGEGGEILCPGGYMRPVPKDKMTDRELHIIKNEASVMAYAKDMNDAVQTIEIYDNLKSQLD